MDTNPSHASLGILDLIELHGLDGAELALFSFPVKTPVPPICMQAPQLPSYRVSVLEAENERLLDELGVLRSYIGPSTTQASQAQACTPIAILEDLWARLHSEAELEAQGAQLRAQREWEAQQAEAHAALKRRDDLGSRCSMDAEREIVQLQQLLIDTKMALAEATSRSDQKQLELFRMESLLMETKLELATTKARVNDLSAELEHCAVLMVQPGQKESGGWFSGAIGDTFRTGLLRRGSVGGRDAKAPSNFR